MKLELKENMYVRTNDGYINKIKKVNQFNVLVYGRDLFGEELNIPNNEITKVSYNIIDILECGDIIKLFMEDDIDGEDTNIFELIAINYNDNEIGVFNSDFQIEFFPIENLRGILTHEQMEQMAYKVGE